MKSVKMSKFAFFGLAFVCCLSLASAVQAETVVPVPNGDFLTTYATTIPGTGFPGGVANVNVPTDWIVTTDPDAPYTDVKTAPDGSKMWWYLGGAWNLGEGWGTLQQSNTATVHAVTDVYTLTFKAMVWATGSNFATSVPADLTADILVNGTSVATKTISFTALSPTPSFTTYSLNWTANTTGELGIRFHTQAGAGFNAETGVGTVGLSYASVPEPSTVVLMVMGLFGLLAYAWRKRK